MSYFHVPSIPFNLVMFWNLTLASYILEDFTIFLQTSWITIHSYYLYWQLFKFDTWVAISIFSQFLFSFIKIQLGLQTYNIASCGCCYFVKDFKNLFYWDHFNFGHHNILMFSDLGSSFLAIDIHIFSFHLFFLIVK